MAQAVPHTVLPGIIAVGVEVLVHLHVGFLHLGTGGALEGEVEGLEDVPPELETTVPQEVLAEAYRQLGGRLQVFQVTLLQFVVVAHKVGAEREALRGERQVLVLHYLQPLAL